MCMITETSELYNAVGSPRSGLGTTVLVILSSLSIMKTPKKDPLSMNIFFGNFGKSTLWSGCAFGLCGTELTVCNAD